MDAKQVLKELIQSVDETDLFNFLWCFSNIGIENETETDDEIDYREIRHDQINNWIDKAIEAACEKIEETELPSVEK